MKKHILILTALFILASFGYATTISSCQNLSSAGTTYTLNQSVSISGQNCFNITAANITLDCAGVTISGNNAVSTNGIYSAEFNTTIRNCMINDFENGIYLIGGNSLVNNVNVSSVCTNPGDGSGITLNTGGYNTINNTIANGDFNCIGLQVTSSSYNTIENSVGKTVNDVGIYIAGTSTYNIILNSNASSEVDSGIKFEVGGDYNNISNSHIIVNGTATGIYIRGANNNIRGNNITGNIWINNSGASNTFNNSTTGNIYTFANGSDSSTVYNTATGTPPY